MVFDFIFSIILRQTDKWVTKNWSCKSISQIKSENGELSQVLLMSKSFRTLGSRCSDMWAYPNTVWNWNDNRAKKFSDEYRGGKLVIMFYGSVESVILATTSLNILPLTEHIHPSSLRLVPTLSRVRIWAKIFHFGNYEKRNGVQEKTFPKLLLCSHSMHSKVRFILPVQGGTHL